MTDDELKALVAENSRAIGELRASRKESEKQWRESRQETERIWRELKESRRESEERWRESRRESEEHRQESRQESERLWQEILASRRETDRLITSFNHELGRLGNALGNYTEPLFEPSLERALREQFGMTVITAPQRVRMHDESFEVDMLGHAGDARAEAYLVEIKSKLRQDGIEQILNKLRQFARFFPEHRGKKLFGVLAALDIPPDLRTRVLKEGLYLATIRDDVFEIVPPDDFEPRAFGLREA